MTLVATAVVAAALIGGAAALWALVRLSLYDGLFDGARQDAAAVSSQLEEGGAATLGEFDDDRLLQIVDPSGDVVARSEGAPLGPATSIGHPAQIVRLGDTDYAIAVEHANPGSTVIAGRPTTSADRTMATLATALAIGVPLLVALVAAVSWVGAGRALAPVERLRRQVGDVTSATLSRRVDEPGTRDEVDRLARTLNDMLGRLDVAHRSQRRFISDASHELKSPLAALRQYAELARDHPDLISADELSAAVLAEGSRLESMVQGMLVLARADEAALRLEQREVDLDDVLLAETARLRGLGGPTVDTSGISAARVHGDIALLRQLVRNLVDNAARHARSRISVAVHQTPDGAVLTVADDGHGIPAGERERVFERFVRLDPGRAREHGGSGLGLAIVAEIVRAHGGIVRITDDATLGGAAVVVELPAAGGSR
ncbi:signal transduction histidine kinase [Microterricola gilva]|uniref:histidine kinase n=1 Tax=Microterricola gilva TaxID=393267 RepID=A0A4Q8AJ99_9MICO|nr:ATP-binding protein [Microterricola gilva]RZU64547.1 signal transduction histidine kinase [Microterricola gilva]